MIEIKIIFVLPKDFDSIKDDIFNNIGNYHNLFIEFNYVALESKNLENELKEYDIKVIIFDRYIGEFTKELYQKLQKENLYIYFHKFKFNINKTNLDELKAFQKIKELKKEIDSIEFDSLESLLNQIKNSLDTQIPKIKTKKERELKPEIDSTFLHSIKINDYFSIKNVEIDNLRDKKEIYFVGENGDGKTILLQAIVLALKGDKYSPFAELYIEDTKDKMKLFTKDREFPNEYKNYKKVKNLFAYGINRNKISEETFDKFGYSGLFDTPDFEDVIKLKKPQNFLKEESTLIDEFVPKLENLMENKIKIFRTKDKVEFKELNGEPIKFGMLSEGYKATIIWLCDLLSRLIENYKKMNKEVTKLEEFEAIVLIDEVDLYLHPKWKYDFMFKLRNIFPNIQFIVTTHSLVTILGASEDAVFYKIYKDRDGNTKVTHQRKHLSYYTSDILMTSPLFGLETMKARGFDEREKISEEDYIFHKIHKVIDKKIRVNPNATDEEIDDWIEAELEKEMREVKNRNLSIPICLNSDKVKKAFDENIKDKKFIASSESYKCKSSTKDEEENEERKLITSLKKIYNSKCAYCESSLLDVYAHIEHYRPKAIYYWLAYSWSNLLPVCPICNNHKSDEFEIESIKKISYKNQKVHQLHFKLTKYNKMEKPKLLHPEIDKFEHLIFFTPKGALITKDKKVQYTIDSCKLNRKDIKEKREKVLNTFLNRLKRIYKLYGTNITYYRDRVESFIEESSSKNEFSLFREFIIKKIDWFIKDYEKEFGDIIKLAIKEYGNYSNATN